MVAVISLIREVPSSSGTGTYTVRRYAQADAGEELWTCNCPGFNSHHGKQLHFWCRHIKKVINEEVQDFERDLRFGPPSPPPQKRKTCSAADCDQSAETKGYCSKHYQQIRKHETLQPEREYGKRGPHCAVPGCDKPVTALDRCRAHYDRHRQGLSLDGKVAADLPDH